MVFGSFALTPGQWLLLGAALFPGTMEAGNHPCGTTPYRPLLDGSVGEQLLDGAGLLGL